MNCLLLLDLAPAYHPMMVGIGKALNKQGHKTFYAIDSPVNTWRFRESPPEGESRFFSHFLANHPKGGEQVDYPWRAFFADFDRYQHFGVNQRQRQDWYRQVASALDAFFTSCIKDWEIDCVIYEGVTNSFAYFANQAAQGHGATYVGVASSRLPGRHELHGPSEDHLRQRVKTRYNRLVSEGVKLDPDAEKWVAEYLHDFEETTPDYMSSNGLLLQNPVSKYAKLQFVTTLQRLAMYQILRRAPKDQCYRLGPPLSYSFHQVKRNTARWIRSKFLKKHFSFPDSEDQFYLYPLHFHPEASTSVNSRWYVDEFTVIKNIAFSLPAGIWLYVKDHPSAFGYPSRNFYRRVAGLPNVKLIAPGSDTKRMIQDAKGVITQTSTVGYEALVLRKPVWVLGEVFYDFHPACLKVGWNEAFEESFIDREQEEVAPEDARALVAAYYLSTLPGTLPLRGESPGAAGFSQLATEIEQWVSDATTAG